MKNSIKTLVAAIVMLFTATITQAAEGNTVTNLNNIKQINKIVVAGNVELILVQDQNEGVQVFDSYYSKNALVQQEDGELRISSFSKEKLTVVVRTMNVKAIEAGNTSSIVTKGQLSLLSLQVTLTGMATADLNLHTIALSTSVNDKAALKLTGLTTEYAGAMGVTAKVTMDQFTAEQSTIRSTAPVYSAKIIPAKERIEDVVESDFR